MNDAREAIEAISRIGAVPTILKVISETTGLRLALVAHVAEDSWTACATLDRMAFGLQPGDTLAIETTLCKKVRESCRPVVIEQASTDPEYADHPIPKMYGFESYLSFPIFRVNGEFFGTLCALDSAPAKLRDEKSISMMTLLTELISLQLAADEMHQKDILALDEEKKTASEREKFIAVVGHDVKTPLASVIVGTEFLLLDEGDTDRRDVLEQIRSSGRRISSLVDDLLDFARGRIGRGIPIRAERVESFGRLVRSIADEVGASQPGRVIRLTGDDPGPAVLDPTRFAQLLTNLITNALEYSSAGAPIDVSMRAAHESVHVAVRNPGTPISPEVAQLLFQPFYRGDATGSAANGLGLGLGLFIVSEIAKAHGGSVTLTSTEENGTKFEVTLPRGI